MHGTILHDFLMLYLMSALQYLAVLSLSQAGNENITGLIQTQLRKEPLLCQHLLFLQRCHKQQGESESGNKAYGKGKKAVLVI